jgi:hypothetical protein
VSVCSPKLGRVSELLGFEGSLNLIYSWKDEEEQGANAIPGARTDPRFEVTGDSQALTAALNSEILIV